MMRTIGLLVLGILIGAAAIGAVAATSSGSDGAVEVRIIAEPLADGRVEVGLQQRHHNGEWGETERPPLRFVPADAEIGRPLHSSPIVVDTDTRHEVVANNYAEYLFESGEGVAGSFTEYFEAVGITEDLPLMLCVEDLNDPGIGQLCDGLESAYAGTVERLSSANYDELRAQLETRVLEDQDLGALFATSVAAADVVDQVAEATRVYLPSSYWIELVDPHLPDEDNLYCLISHGGEDDLFWGLAAESSVAAAGALHINVRAESYAVAAEQAEAVRRCVADGASAIATTLAEPEVLKPAVREAIDAGIPVLSFNSGAEAASEVGTVMHISLDDREGGRIAGDEFNARGIEGNVLCVIHQPTNIGLHDRCDGFEERFSGTVERWSPTSTETDIDDLEARLAEGDVDGVLALSSDSGTVVRIVIFLTDADIPTATFGWSRLIGELVAEGRMMFTILDHPELQPYLAAVASVMAERLRIDPGAYFNGAQVLIRPTIADAEDMQALRDSLIRQE